MHSLPFGLEKFHATKIVIYGSGVWCSLLSNLCAGKKPEVKKEEKKQVAPALAPTKANVPYGTHERQVLDFYQAKSDSPTPVVFYIHGGGW